MLRRTFLAQIAFALDSNRADKAFAVVKRAVDSGDISAAAAVFRQGTVSKKMGWGKAQADTVFLLASITKPMTAVGVMTLVERGLVKLEDPVRKYIPEFTGAGRDVVAVKHLLTHTSGLPDMLPENEALRKKHAPLKEFVAGTCRTPLLFAPGSKVQYQSMGILLAAEIAERVTKKPFRDLLKDSVYAPLGMTQTSLGLGGRAIPTLAQCQVTGNDDWNWNSPYWRDLGAPWGGAHASAIDVATFLEAFLDPKGKAVKVGTARFMVTNQNAGLNEPWGIGFMVNGAKFGKQCSPNTFGHWGSTGTVCWADPVSKTIFVLLTTKPATDSRGTVLGPASDAAAG